MIDPEVFDTIRTIFFAAILLFFVFAAIQILAIKSRIDNPRPRPAPPHPPKPGGTGEYRKDSATHATFGTSGIGASDVSPAGAPAPLTSDTSAGDSYASTSWDSSDTGGGDYGGGDYSGGGGDSGGGGSSGSWS